MPKNSTNFVDIVNQMAINNSEKAYKELFKLLFKPLSEFAYCFLKSYEQAEELASDVMFILWDRRVDLLIVENIQAYAFIIVKNRALSSLKKIHKNETISLDDISIEVFLNYETPEEILISEELRLILESAINSLPPKGKMVFKLIKEDGFSYKEVGDILNISTKTVDAHLVTALKKITTILNKEFNLS